MDGVERLPLPLAVPAVAQRADRPSSLTRPGTQPPGPQSLSPSVQLR